MLASGAEKMAPLTIIAYIVFHENSVICFPGIISSVAFSMKFLVLRREGYAIAP